MTKIINTPQSKTVEVSSLKITIKDELVTGNILKTALIKFNHNNQNLECITCTKLNLSECKWCPHIEIAVTNNLDGKLIWERINLFHSIHRDSSVVISCAWLPTFNKFVDLKFDKINDDFHKLILFINNSTYTSIFKTGTEIYLGLTDSSDSTNTWRRMILSWFNSVIDTDKLKCLDLSHGIKQQNDWTVSLNNTNSKIAQFWTVLNTGYCIGCNNKTKSFLDTVPSLDNNWSGTFSRTNKTISSPEWTL